METKITINGKLLTDDQAMTLRVAVANFYTDLQVNGIGEGEVGKTMALNYLDRLNEIYVIMG
jgi:hypothetical protein